MPRGIPNKKPEPEKVAPPERYNIKNANRLRLTLEKGSLDATCFDGVTIENTDVRTISFKDCIIKDSTFKNVIMQGCDFSEALECTGNVFISCDLRWGRKPGGFEKNNQFINTRL